MLRSACVHKSEALFLFKKTASPQPIYSLSPAPSPNGEGRENHCLQIKESLTPVPSPNGEGRENHCLQIKKQPHPQPLSEWRGEWKLLFADKEGVSLVWRKALYITTKRPSRLEKRVSLISKYNYLYSHLPSSHILLVVFTPLSIRRGGGGEAVVGLLLGCS